MSSKTASHVGPISPLHYSCSVSWKNAKCICGYLFIVIALIAVIWSSYDRSIRAYIMRSFSSGTSVTPHYSTSVTSCSDSFLNICTPKTAILVELEGRWCSACHEFNNFIRTTIGKKIIANYYLDSVDEEVEAALVACFKSRGYLDDKYGLPAFLLFKSNGQYVATTYGYDREGKFIDKLERALRAKNDL